MKDMNEKKFLSNDEGVSWIILFWHPGSRIKKKQLCYKGYEKERIGIFVEKVTWIDHMQEKRNIRGKMLKIQEINRTIGDHDY